MEGWKWPHVSLGWFPIYDKRMPVCMHIQAVRETIHSWIIFYITHYVCAVSLNVTNFSESLCYFWRCAIACRERKLPIDDIIISKFSSASISKRKMVLDTDCLNILIFMICILSVNQSNISFVLYRTVVARSRSEISIYIFLYIKYSTSPRITVYKNYQAYEMN